MANTIQQVLNMRRNNNQRRGHVLLGVTFALTVLAGVLCGHYWSSSSESAQDIHVPHGLRNNSHKEAILKKPKHVKIVWVKQPQNLWEYKAVNLRKLLFQMSWARTYPRFTMLYLYFFEYTETFLPFIHSVCPDHAEDVTTKSLDLKDPTRQQWITFLLKCTLAHQLIAEFAWLGRAAHYWTTVFIIIQALSLSALELICFWSFWSKREWKALPFSLWGHVNAILLYGNFTFLYYCISPDFLLNFDFYWMLYVEPLNSIESVVRIAQSL
uniref:Uncharacterized protein n=1 Tax=Chrysemys picta bellii TaxID=8478 RepID=A0A8C3HSI8_CHRPI